MVKHRPMTRDEKVKWIPSQMRGTYLRSPTSRASAIKAFCQECCGYQREEVRQCTAESCPLFAWRPYQAGDADTEEAGDAADAVQEL